MKIKKKDVLIDRLKLFDSGHPYPSSRKVTLQSEFYSEAKPYKTLKVYSPGEGKTILFDEMLTHSEEFKDVEALPQSYGNSWDSHWFFIEFEITDPTWLADDVEIHFLWNSNSEALIFSTQGDLLQGLTGDVGEAHRVAYILKRNGIQQRILQQGKCSFYIEMACCNLMGTFIDGNMTGGLDLEKKFTLQQCECKVFNRRAYNLYYDFKTIESCAFTLLPQQSSICDEAYYTCNQIINKCKVGDESTYGECEQLASAFLNKTNASTQHEVFAMGHCHIDVAWLWPFSETRRKSARSWSSQIELMLNYPEYKFTQSQAILYDWVKQDYPKLFLQLQQFSDENKFVPVGGTWVEFDGNIPSGESMARQFLYGQNFFKENFNKYCNTFFLPDTFGYSAQLPQIAKLSGIKYFVTQKLSWNYFNKPPNSTFYWKGIDSTALLSHFPPADTYNGNGDLSQIMHSQDNFRDKGRVNSSLYLYGIGDGGGGPLPEMIEKLIRQKDLEGVPKVKMNNVDEFFQKVEEEDAVKKGVVTWDGELFFELHNGTYTSQANNKKYNRQCEIALRSAELFSVFNILVEKIRDTTGGVYDKALFDTCWKDVLLYQFHDVIPGSSIVTVYDTTNASYPQILTSLDENIKASFEGIVSNFIKLKPVGSQENAAIFFNSLHFARQEVIGLQVGDTKIYTRVQIPQLGLAVYPINNLLSNPIPNALINYKIENKIIKIETPQLLLEIPEKTGEITSIKDKETGDLSFPEIKELIKGDTEFTGGNRLCIHNDVPLYWDAWDLWVYYMESRVDIFPESDSPQITELPHQLQITFKYKIPQTKGTQQQSSVSLTICVNAYTKRIDFKMEVHWYENHRILRVYFPLNIKTNFVTCDIQYGNLRRVNHSNTSWDLPKYEFCSHQFVDMSETNYGVALLNDSKYGYSARTNILGMSLLKSPKGPDTTCDMGDHTFTYSLYPHLYDFSKSDVPEEGLKLNMGIKSQILSVEEEIEKSYSLLEVDKTNIVIDAIKFDEKENKELIIRLHENKGEECVCKLKHNFKNLPPVSYLKERIAEAQKEIPSGYSYPSLIEVQLSTDSKYSALLSQLESKNEILQFYKVTLNNILELEDPELFNCILEATTEHVLLKFKPFKIVTLRIQVQQA